MNRLLLLSLLLMLMSVVQGGRYYVGFTTAPSDGGTVVSENANLGADLLSVLGPTPSYVPAPASGDTVLIAWGKYYLTSELIIPAGVVVQGGYNPNASTTLTRVYPGAVYPSSAPTFANMTILDGNAFFTSSRAKKHRVATVHGTLETCYIRGGHVNELSSGIPNKGGGLYIDGGTVVSCIVRGNVANNITSHATTPALGGGVYLTNGGKIYNSLIVNNMANRGYGVYGEADCIMTNATVIYNTFAPISVPVPGTGDNIAQNATDTANYYLHQVHSLTEADATTYDGDVKVQLTDFYLGETETTCLQYCVFLAGVDYTVSSTVIVLANNYRDSLWTLKVYNTGTIGEAGYKAVRVYYGTNVAGSDKTDEQYCTTNGCQLCGTDNSSNDFGYLRLVNKIVVPKESTRAGTIPDDDISVCYVSWYGSLAYSQWLGGSLPTEAQWEFALRRKSSENFQAPTAGTAVGNQSASLYNESYAYNGYTTGQAISGTEVPSYFWYGGNNYDVATASAYGSTSGGHTHKVGEKKPNGLGLYDMNGNVWEWCADFYPGREDYLLTDYVGNDGIEGSIVVNPINNTVAGSTSPPSRFFRGGGWTADAGYLRAGCRRNRNAYDRNINIGFRPAFLLPFTPSAQ